MKQRDMAVIQGMLDARKNFDLPDSQVIVCPFDIETESELYDRWWEGFNFHRHPNIVTC